MPNGEGFTLKEILLRVEDKLDAAVNDHEQRIRALERWKWGLPVSVIGAAAAAITTILHGGI